MSKPANKPMPITKRRHRWFSIVDGVKFTVHYRQFKDKRGKVRRVIAGPGLREAT